MGHVRCFGKPNEPNVYCHVFLISCRNYATAHCKWPQYLYKDKICKSKCIRRFTGHESGRDHARNIFLVPWTVEQTFPINDYR